MQHDDAESARSPQPVGRQASRGVRTRIRVVLVEDDLDARRALSRAAASEGFEVQTAATLEAARELIAARPPGLVVTGLRVPMEGGVDLAGFLRTSPVAEAVVVTGDASAASAGEALRLGAFDDVPKPFDDAQLQRVFRKLRRTMHDGELGVRHGKPRQIGRFGRLIGASAEMRRLYDVLTRAGSTDDPVLLTGESGTGKELAALTLHELSPRRARPFLAVNCGALPAAMVESELFGHERGSFTGAVQRHAGIFERAAGGTLFLDEIAEMPGQLQVRLLRVLECGSVVRLGGEKEIPVDVRVVAATNRVPETEVAEGRLREDLFYRLAVLRVALPPLRRRGADVRLLAEHFLRGMNVGARAPKTFSPGVLAAMARHPWPGNVRELRNVVRSAFVMSDDAIACEHLRFGPVRCSRAPGIDGAAIAPGVPDTIDRGVQDAPALAIFVGMSAAEAERLLLLATLEACGGDKQAAARILSVSLKTMYNRLRTYAEAARADAAPPQ